MGYVHLLERYIYSGVLVTLISISNDVSGKLTILLSVNVIKYFKYYFKVIWKIAITTENA